jgi:hypothetical protein
VNFVFTLLTLPIDDLRTLTQYEQLCQRSLPKVPQVPSRRSLFIWQKRYLQCCAKKLIFIGFDDKKFVWIAVAKDEYTPAEILSESGGKLTVRTQKGDELTVEREKAEFVNPPKFDGVEDCAELSYLSEAAVLHNLRKRYEADIIYVRVLHERFFVNFFRLILVFSWS